MNRPSSPPQRERRLLVVGWNQRSPWFLEQLELAKQERWRVVFAGAATSAERAMHLSQSEVQLSQCVVEQVRCDPTSVVELRQLGLDQFDTILVQGSDKLESAEDADARTLLVYQLIGRQLSQPGTSAGRPRILVELRDPANADLFEGSATEIVATSDLLTHILAQLSLRPELRPVLDQLLAEHGPEIGLLPAEALGLSGRMSFRELLAAGAQLHCCVLGVRLVEEGAEPAQWLNPSRERTFEISPRLQLIALADAKVFMGVSGG